MRLANVEQLGMPRTRQRSARLVLLINVFGVVMLSSISSYAESSPVRADPVMPTSQPPYPADSKRFNEEGTVVLKLDVLENGRVAAAELEKSSGFKRLDDAAIAHAIKQWRFLPATNNNAPIRSSHTVAVKFQMIKSRRF